MNLFHTDDERNHPVERRTHKKSSSGFSLWSRKSFKRSNTAHATSPVSPQVDITSLRSDLSGNDHQRSSHNGFQRQLSFQGSLLEDARRAMAFTSEEPSTWDAIPVATVHVSYHIHNPLGPRWYKNHHLIPPSQTKPGMRPPTFFSPSFPPISTSSTPDHHIDSEGSTRTHSHSPLPTPASSQTRVGEGGVKPRSRKTSQTAPDNVDLLDVTDPWGTNWHHESPYDVGQTSGAPDGDGLGKRLRRASMTAAQNSLTKSTIPSPVSQSTSAVHLHALEQPSYPPPSTIPHTIHLPRKLNKRKPTLDGLFRPPTRDEDRKAVSAPPTPMERIHLADSPPPDQASLPKRMSVAPPLNQNYTFTPVSSHPTPKKEKRTSVLNRIAKKLSLLTKSSTDDSDHREYSWLHVNQDDARISMKQSSQPQPNYPPSEVKRVPPPALETTKSPKKDAPSTHSRRRGSSVSVETPFLVGNLTVANPDSPESGRETPHEPLPIANPIPIHLDDASAVLSNGATEHSGPSRSPSPTAFGYQTWAAYEKPLPVPAPSTAANTPFLNGKSLSSLSSDASSKDGEEDKDKGNLLKSGMLSSNTTKETIKAPKVDPPSVLTIDEETTQSAVSHKAVVDKSVVGDPSDSPDTHKSEKDGDLPSPSLPPIPVTTPFLDTISLRHTTSRASGLSRAKTPNPPPKLEPPQLPPLTSRDSKATTANVYITLSPEELTAQDRINSYLYTDSPYTATSVLANPPTPNNRPASIALTPEPELPPLPPTKPPKEKRSSDEASPSHTTPTRQTETFKLVRSLSGNVVASTETIPAAGEQWEVVGSNNEQKPKPRTPTSASKRESKRESRGEGSGSSKQQTKVVDEGERRRSKSNRQSKQLSQSQEVSTIPMPKLSGSSRHSPPRHEDEGRRHGDQQRESSRYYEDHRRHTKYRSDDGYRRSDDARHREERARLEEDRRIEEQKRYEEERREKDRERRRRDREREKEKERAREREREERKERDRVERERGNGERREWERLEREKEVEQYERMETERLLTIEREKLERERQEREKEREALERERLALELERERLKREKERDRERRREEERYAREQEKERERKLRLEEERRALEKEQKRREREERRAAEERRIAEERRAAEAQSRSRRKREERKDDGIRKLRKSEQRKSEAMRVESYISYAPHQIQASSSSSSDSRPVERRPSISTRPTSELPSAANLNALRAKEAWDMERLWKARSMYGAEWNNGAVGTQSMTSFQDDPTASHVVAYGSGHTAFLVQAPFQTPGSNIYHSMPNKPPPIIYGSPASIPSLPDSSYDPYDRNNIATYQPPNGYSNGSPSKSLMATSTILSRSALLNNPLPEPPRESTYQPAPLPPLKPGSNRSDSWVKYTSVTTAH